MIATVVLQVVVLILGSVLFSVMSENIAGNESFSLPFFGILLVTLLGAVLSVWWGWSATLATLAAYGAFCAIGGFLERSR